MSFAQWTRYTDLALLRSRVTQDPRGLQPPHPTAISPSAAFADTSRLPGRRRRRRRRLLRPGPRTLPRPLPLSNEVVPSSASTPTPTAPTGTRGRHHHQRGHHVRSNRVHGPASTISATARSTPCTPSPEATTGRTAGAIRSPWAVPSRRTEGFLLPRPRPAFCHLPTLVRFLDGSRVLVAGRRRRSLCIAGDCEESDRALVFRRRQPTLRNRGNYHAALLGDTGFADWMSPSSTPLPHRAPQHLRCHDRITSSSITAVPSPLT